jgi:hypothetical protein
VNRKIYATKEQQTSSAADADLATWVWLVRGGIAKATILPTGEIKGMKLDAEGKLVEIVIQRPNR